MRFLVEAFGRVRRFLTPVDAIEYYLSQSANLADLENRMRDVASGKWPAC